MVKNPSGAAGEQLVALRKKEEEDLLKIMAGRRGLPYLDLSKMTIDIDSLKILPEADARAYQAVVIQSVGKKLQVAVTNPERMGLAEILENLKRKKYEVQLFLISPTSLERALAKYKEVPVFEEMRPGIVEVPQEKIQAFGNSLKSLKKLKEIVEEMARESESKKASESLELVLVGALGIEASDVHLEPSEADAKFRLRIDGVLQDLASIPLTLFNLLLSRIKLVSELKLNVREKPQDGRFTIRTGKEDIEVRTSTLPGSYGESVVMRLLLPGTIGITFDQLGMQPPVYEMMTRELDRPNGMILNTGPTGSGKTTTLYAFLKKISSPEYKMITIEDPVEYHLANVTQTQVDRTRGYDFSNGLRSILRQDPDIILVGEIRDLETAEIAMHAALTGHLVFSTLHTNDAAGTVPRLIDLGVKTNIIAPAINVIMAQRLVRVLCLKCKKESVATAEEEKIILENLKAMPAAYKIQEKEIKLWKESGCEECNFTGFKGRIGIFETFLVDDEIERLIMKNPPQADISKAAREQGMLTMYQDGILKVIKGVTSFEELNREVTSGQ